MTMDEKKRIIRIRTGLNTYEKEQAVLSDIFRVFNAYKPTVSSVSDKIRAEQSFFMPTP